MALSRQGRGIARYVRKWGTKASARAPRKPGSPAHDVALDVTLEEYRARLAVASTSVHHTWRCRGAYCRQWTMDGAYKTGICNFCGEQRGPDQ